MKGGERRVDYHDLFQKELTLINSRYESQAELFEYTSKILEKEQYVEPTFREAVTSREVVFPTGLEMNGIKIAIPHTDTIFVKRPFVLVNKLSTPIPFIQMGSSEKWIDVEVIFMLGIKTPKDQVPLLSSIMEKFMEADFVEQIKTINDSNTLCDFLIKQFGE
ncbi:PTS system galactitol-specific enzyme IIA component [Listeria monocytogenes]|nr:PTS system galactitol-specific enzyme IIA component [Listeria monocytogenes]CUL24145.1 PTS system galactitol-specific enzyme IIA component [Listeria monocytogenes]